MATASDVSILTQPTHQGGRLGREESRAKRTEFFNRYRARRELDLARRTTRLRETEAVSNKELMERKIAADLEAQKAQAQGAKVAGIAQTAVALPQSYLLYKSLAGDTVKKEAIEKGGLRAVSEGLSVKGTGTGAKYVGTATGGFGQPALGAYAGPGSTVGAYALPFAAGYGVSRMIGGANKETKVGAGFAAGAVTGAVYGANAGPYGIALGAIVGGIMGAAGASCIIVTTCTSADSYEVDISRRYRDMYLDSMTLRGYYMVAEKIVPLIITHSWVKKMVKYVLVDRLVRYAEYKLNTKRKHFKNRFPLISWGISKSFLFCCKQIGKTRVSFTRSNMEVV